MTAATQSHELPLEIRGSSVWYGPDIATRRDWIEPLGEVELAEIEAATRRLASRDVDLATIDRGQFELPTLAPRLERILRDVLEGHGFALLRGLPIEHRSMRDAAIMFLGIGAHLGSARSQNARGHLLGHVTDLGLSSTDPNVRIYQTHERQTFHTDSCDVVALLCLRTARSGGLSSLVSSMTMFNEIRRRRPDLLAMLLEPIETDRRGEVPDGALPYFRLPVFNSHAGLVSAIYQRQYIDSARRLPGVPALTPVQREALDLFDALADDPALHFRMELQPGDIQLVHNHTVLHDRTAFQDWPDPERRRHLLRLWLAPRSARALPEAFAQRFGSVTPGDRGGILVRGSRPIVPLTP